MKVYTITEQTLDNVRNILNDYAKTEDFDCETNVDFLFDCIQVLQEIAEENMDD